MYPGSSVDADLEWLSSFEHDWHEGALQLRRIRAALSVRYNTRVKVNQLPVEILRMIFSLCGSMFEPEWGRSSGLDITATCTHWRAVALAYPGMWTDLDISGLSSKQIGRLFSLSRDLPLQIRHEDYEPAYLQRRLNLISVEMHRVKKLELSIDEPLSDSTLRPFLQAVPAPIGGQSHLLMLESVSV